MKRSIIISSLGLLLASCSNGYVVNPSQSKGIVDCYSVQVFGNGSATSFSGVYYQEPAAVYEYKSKDGKTFYSEYNTMEIAVYANRYTSSSTMYTNTRFVGYLTRERNYYLNLETRVIDCEIKLIENKSEEYNANDANNKEAYEKAKSGYITIDAIMYVPSPAIRLDTANQALERHSYYVIGDGYSFQYTKKWF